MREIVLDTETTGFDPQSGDRIVEIGAIELIGHVATGNQFHEYINPERSMPQDAFEVHGLGDDFLKDKPVFKAVSKAFLNFIGDSKLVIHNASFDMKFLNAELSRAGMQKIPSDRAIDTLEMARRKFPGSPASLDSLCRRFGIDNSARTLHGALLDSEILAEVYLELIGGRQPDLVLSPVPQKTTELTTQNDEWVAQKRPQPLAKKITEAEQAAHLAFIERLGDKALW